MAKYTLDALERKYNYWKAPTAKLFINGKEIGDKDWRIVSVETETGVGYPSGFCTLTITGVYDRKNSKFTCEDSFVLGMPVDVQLGYVVTASVFMGYLYSLEYNLGNEKTASVTLNCMDVKAAMMGAGRLGLSDTVTYKQAIQGFFSGNTARGYAELCKAPDMGGLPELERAVGFATSRMDDYTFLTETARRFGLECFALDDKLVLRKKPASGSPLIALSGIRFIYNINAVKSTAGYVSSVTVYGGSDNERDSEKKRAMGQAKNDIQIAPKGSAAGRLIGDRSAELFSAGVRDKKGAEELAQAQLRIRQERASDITLTMQGIPEMKHGSYFSLERISPQINGQIYIVSVSHVLDEDGYRTTVHGRKEG